MQDDQNLNSVQNDERLDEHEDNDIVLEPDAENSDQARQSSFKKKTQSEGETELYKTIETLRAEKQEYLAQWQKAQADFVNLRKRDEEDKKEFVKFASARVIEDMLPVLESFDMAKSDTAKWESIDPTWRAGVDGIYAQLQGALKKHGVVELNPVGAQFDPREHEALTQVPVTDKAQDNVIVQVVQKGYALSGKVIRAPRVIVGSFA